MDLINDEPRKHPSPVPFCQSLIEPSVPEVSLVLPNYCDSKLGEKKEFPSGNEFQSYNAWKWKNMNSSNGFKNSESNSYGKCSGIDNCCVIKDKYSSYNVEKRKNEILYGDVDNSRQFLHLHDDEDEPRRPLPPRVVPIVNTTSDILSSFSTFDNFSSPENDTRGINKTKYVALGAHENLMKPKKLLDLNCNNENDNSKLYTIITEQNNQIKVLQNQIEQLLNLQQIKDKQIEQILKTQEAKERKIDQLLQCVETKEKEVDKLMKTKEKQEDHIQELLKKQEKQQKENILHLENLKELQQKKNVESKGTMTCTIMVDFGVNTDMESFLNGKNNDSNIMRNSSEISGINGRDKSLSLHSVDLPIIMEHLPSPQSSIHVDIQDFHDSSEESDTDSITLSNNCPTPGDQYTPIGYTFYNNVLTQVKDIIQNSGEKDKKILEDISNSNCEKTDKSLVSHIFNKKSKKPKQNQIIEIIPEKEKVFSCNKDMSGNHFIHRQVYESSNLPTNKDQSPSDVSFKINALAMKYLKKEQILQYNLDPQFSNICQPDVTIYNVTNLSVNSMRYLEGHKLYPNVKRNVQQKVILMNECAPIQITERKKKYSVEENLNSPLGNVLDINSLNQQTKLF